MQCEIPKEKLEIKLRKERTLHHLWKYMKGDDKKKVKVVHARRNIPPDLRRMYRFLKKRKRHHKDHYHYRKKHQSCRPYIRRTNYQNDPYVYGHAGEYLPQNNYYENSNLFNTIRTPSVKEIKNLNRQTYKGQFLLRPMNERLNLRLPHNQFQIKAQQSKQSYVEDALHFMKAPDLSPTYNLQQVDNLTETSNATHDNRNEILDKTAETNLQQNFSLPAERNTTITNASFIAETSTLQSNKAQPNLAMQKILVQKSGTRRKPNGQNFIIKHGVNDNALWINKPLTTILLRNPIAIRKRVIP